MLAALALTGGIEAFAQVSRLAPASQRCLYRRGAMELRRPSERQRHRRVRQDSSCIAASLCIRSDDLTNLLAPTFFVEAGRTRQERAISSISSTLEREELQIVADLEVCHML